MVFKISIAIKNLIAKFIYIVQVGSQKYRNIIQIFLTFTFRLELNLAKTSYGCSPFWSLDLLLSTRATIERKATGASSPSSSFSLFLFLLGALEHDLFLRPFVTHFLGFALLGWTWGLSLCSFSFSPSVVGCFV